MKATDGYFLKKLPCTWIGSNYRIRGDHGPQDITDDRGKEDELDREVVGHRFDLE